MTEKTEETPVQSVVEELSFVLENHGDRQALFYFPAAVDGKLVKDHPLANYAFVNSSLRDSHLLSLERSTFVDNVLCSTTQQSYRRLVNRVTEEEIVEAVGKKLQSLRFDIGTNVLIERGLYEGFYGTVVEVNDTLLKVYVELHSRRRLVDINCSDVSKQE